MARAVVPTGRLEALAVARKYFDLLIHELGELSSGSPDRPQQREVQKSALQAFQRHARAVVSDYAFVDGEPVDTPHEVLLTAFYADPEESVSSRYCWALLEARAPPALDIEKLIAATQAEHEAFAKAHAEPARANPEHEPDHAAMQLEIQRLEQHADRLCYSLSILRRLHIIQKYARRRSLRALEAELQALATASLAIRHQLNSARIALLRARP